MLGPLPLPHDGWIVNATYKLEIWLVDALGFVVKLLELFFSTDEELVWFVLVDLLQPSAIVALGMFIMNIATKMAIPLSKNNWFMFTITALAT